MTLDAQAAFSLGAKLSEWMSAFACAAMPTRHAACRPDLSASSWPYPLT